MVQFPNAKINIGLDVIAKRDDGFHEIHTAFYPIQWCDVLEIVKSDTLQLTVYGLDIEGDINDNICIKAYHLLKEKFNIDPVHIYLKKVIPMGAGLGGGSSDGAFTLKILNRIFNLLLTTQELENYARKLGSDCAFFIDNTPKIAVNKGDIFLNTIPQSLKGKYIVLINPRIHISTKEAYSGVVPSLKSLDIESKISMPLNDWQHNIRNDFEDTILKNHPLLAQIKIHLINAGAFYAAMSGSGSTMFGLFNHPIDITQFKKEGFIIYENWMI